MDVRIRPHTLAGAVTPPPSKSMAHRLLLAAALADGVSTVQNVALSQDIEATLRCMAALGASWEQADKSTLRVTGIGGKRKPFTAASPARRCAFSFPSRWQSRAGAYSPAAGG